MHTGEKDFCKNHIYEKLYSCNCGKKKKKGVHSAASWESRHLQMSFSCELAGYPLGNVVEKLPACFFALSVQSDHTEIGMSRWAKKMGFL